MLGTNLYGLRHGPALHPLFELKDIHGQQVLGQEDRKANSAGSAESHGEAAGELRDHRGGYGPRRQVWVFSLC